MLVSPSVRPSFHSMYSVGRRLSSLHGERCLPYVARGGGGGDDDQTTSDAKTMTPGWWRWTEEQMKCLALEGTSPALFLHQVCSMHVGSCSTFPQLVNNGLSSARGAWMAIWSYGGNTTLNRYDRGTTSERGNPSSPAWNSIMPLFFFVSVSLDHYSVNDILGKRLEVMWKRSGIEGALR